VRKILSPQKVTSVSNLCNGWSHQGPTGSPEPHGRRGSLKDPKHPRRILVGKMLGPREKGQQHQCLPPSTWWCGPLLSFREVDQNGEITTLRGLIIRSPPIVCVWCTKSVAWSRSVKWCFQFYGDCVTTITLHDLCSTLILFALLCSWIR